MNELLPEVDLIIRNLIDTMEEMDSGYDNMALIIYLIILFNRTEFLDEYKELLIKSEYWDVYLENLIQILDPTRKISTEELCCPKYTNYIKRAGDTTYFDMGEDWEIQTKEYWLDKRGKQMFKLYNRPALDDAINSGKQLRFSHDPRNYHDCALEWEWNYIKN